MRQRLIQTVVHGYMAYLRQRRFETFYIWVMAPASSDPEDPASDYMFNYRPAYQRIPDQKRLESWYLRLLEGAKQRGILADYYDNTGNTGEKRKMKEAFSESHQPTAKRTAASVGNMPLFTDDIMAKTLLSVAASLENEGGLERCKSLKLVQKVQEKLKPQDMGSYIICHFTELQVTCHRRRCRCCCCAAAPTCRCVCVCVCV